MKYFHIGAWEAMSRTQLPKVMKLTAILLTICSLQVAAHSGAQITYQGKDVSLRKALEVVRIQGGVYMAYNEQDLDLAKPVTVSFKNTSVKEALDVIFKDQPLTYSIVNKTVFVVKKITTGVELANVQPPLITVRGRVINEENDPVAGVTVMVKGTKIGTFTNGDGQFELNKIDVTTILLLTAVNILSIEVNVNGRTEIAIQVQGKTGKLDEVQVIAYGKTSQRFNTGNVTTVKAEDIEKQPVNNPLLALQGRVPGLVITQSSGLPGSGISVQIQGQNSLSRGNDPLYIIDGVPYSSQLLPNLGAVLGTSGNTFGLQSGNPLSFINPADIESIDILKDADATAIYGSRAANGAILITTKKGKAGKTRMNINMQSGWGKVERKLDLMNTQQYLQMRHEAFANDNASPNPVFDADINGFWDTTRYTNWQKELIGGTSRYTDVHTTISGGNTTTQYLIGGGYHRETTVFPGDFADQKGSMHFSVTNVSLDQKFRIHLTGNYLVDNNNLIGTDLTSTAIILPPNAPTIYNPDGNLNWATLSTGFTSWLTGNPLSYLLNKYKSRTNNLVSNAMISYQLLPGLEIKSSIGYTNMQMDESIVFPLVYFQPAVRQSVQRSARYVANNISSWIIEPQVTYDKNFGKGRITVLVGTTIQQNKSKGQILNASGFNSDLVLEDIKSAATVTVGSTVNSQYKYNALFGRINYCWKDKYILNLTARRDGSSRFGPANNFHNFQAASVGWIFSKENFIEKDLAFISFGKIRGSYGTTGNDLIGDYQYLNLYAPIGNVGIPYQGVAGLGINELPNPHLQWEETKKLQFGLDLGFLKDRILLNVNYFHNRSSNQLIASPLPIISGFPSVTKNLSATIQNNGWEFSLNTSNLKIDNFSWTSNLNLTIPKNKLVDFPNLVTSPYANIYVIGQPINITKTYHFLGVDPTTGIYQFANAQGNATTTPNSLTDKTVIINASFPTYYGGFQNNLRYKGFELDFLFQFVKQIGQNYISNRLPGFMKINQPVSVLNRWQKPGDQTNIQRFNQNNSLFGQYTNMSFFSDVAYSNASFIKLKNLSLSWQLPIIWNQKMYLQSCRIYIQGQNLLTLTNYSGLDPETKSSTTLPPLRMITVGLQVGL